MCETMTKMRFMWVALMGALLTGPASAQEIDPALVSAVELSGQGDYPAALDQILPGDLTGQTLLTWLRLRNGDGAFEDYRAFLSSHSGWPSAERLTEAAERAIPKGTDPDAVIDFFASGQPLTGQGAVRLAEALTVKGRIDVAKEVIVAAWLNLRLGETETEVILDAFGDVVAPYHAARADALLWRWRRDEARELLPLLSGDAELLVRARLAYLDNRDVAAAAAAVPAALRSTPGLVYDRYNWLAERGNQTEAVALLREASQSAATLQDPFRWSGWRRSLARWEMREGRAQSAYELASRHFLTEGSAYADLEWLSGYIALRYLDDPALALKHFETLSASVDGPISQGRAGYWMGRAHAALGDANAAAAAYAQGAKHQTSFYGLLAAEQLGMQLDPSLTGRADIVDWQNSPVMQDPLVIAALALLEGGERGYATEFFAHIGQVANAAEIGRLARMMEDRDDPYYSVLLGKAAAERGIIVPSAYFPLHDVAQMELPADPELTLSIARRESEFNFRAGSPVGALGLMQLMPATAEEVAGFLDLPYSKPRLTSDWRYNAQLGARYLAELEAEFGPSPVQIAAGYNAGPSRPKAWMDEFGDPRLGEVDVIDWIEHIPFRETRDYVQRVTESMPVYQARLTGRTGPVAFTALLLGEKPLARPALRPTGFPPPAAAVVPDAPTEPALPEVPDVPAAVETVETVSSSDDGASDSATAASPRPRARPDN